MIRIYQPDVWRIKNNWELQLLNAIKKYDTPMNIFIGDIYEQCYDTEQMNPVAKSNNHASYPQNLNDFMLRFQGLTIQSPYVYKSLEPPSILFDVV